MSLRVVVSGAAGNIGYAILPMIASGQAFGRDQKVHLVLLDIPQCLDKLKGVAMELNDCSFPLLTGMTLTADYSEAFLNADYVALIGGFPRRKGMLRKDLLGKNRPIFEKTGDALAKYAKKTTKVLVVANPANTNCLIACEKAKGTIPPENFCALTRLDQNRAKGILADLCKTTPDKIKNMIIWGNHSATQVPDVSIATVEIDGKDVPVRDVVKDDDYLQGDFMKTVKTRGKAIIQARGLSSAMSAANAAKDCLHSWHFGTRPGETVAMAIYSDGKNLAEYGVPAGIMYSGPIEVKGGKVIVKSGLKVSDFYKNEMAASAKELLEERAESGL